MLVNVAVWFGRACGLVVLPPMPAPGGLDGQPGRPVGTGPLRVSWT